MTTIRIPTETVVGQTAGQSKEGFAMAVTDQQVRKLMSEYQKMGKLEKAALRAGIDRKTAR